MNLNDMRRRSTGYDPASSEQVKKSTWRIGSLICHATQMFSDFGGIIQKRFARNVSEKTSEIRRELVAAGIIPSSVGV
jgi:hypothetical protein